MTCDDVRARLTALADNELAQAEAAEVQAHLSHCAACRQEREEIARTLVMAEAWPVAGGEVWEEVQAQTAPDDLAAVLTELRGLRAELRGLRAEMTDLRRQIALRALEPPRRPAPPLFPYAAPADPPLRLGGVS